MCSLLTNTSVLNTVGSYHSACCVIHLKSRLIHKRHICAAMGETTISFTISSQGGWYPDTDTSKVVMYVKGSYSFPR